MSEATSESADINTMGGRPSLSIGANVPAGNKTSRSQGHDNAFDLLRLGLALLVVYTHVYLLGGYGVEGFSRFARGQASAGTFAVLGFFGISGFLVTRSFVARNNWRIYVKARLLRILPGFYFSLFFTAFVCAPIVSALNPASAGWHLSDAVRFLGKNALIIIGQWNVGDVLTNLPYSGSINGALWSLFPEICCYGAVLGFGIVGSMRSRASMIPVLGTLLVLHVALIISPRQENLAPTLLSLTGWTPYTVAFFVGSLIYVFRDQFELGGKQALFWCGVALVLLKFGGWALAGPIVLPLAILNLAHAVRIELPADFSYGIYILHFPILQALAAGGVANHGVLIYMSTGIAVTLLCSAVSWYTIEAPMLRLK